MDRRKRKMEKERKRAARLSQTAHCVQERTAPFVTSTHVVQAGTLQPDTRSYTDTQGVQAGTSQPDTKSFTDTRSAKPLLSSNRKRTAAQSCLAADVHEHSFHGLQAEDVLNGELSIQMMDFVSRILKAQYPSSAGLFAPSFLVGLEMSSQHSEVIKLDKNSTAVQIHFVNNHYVVSAQCNRLLYVYDSLYNLQHLLSLQYQLQLLYENFNITSVKYVVSQSQGTTNLCGFFAIATAETLLRNSVPGSRFLDCSLMRTHLYKCLQDASITEFPQYSVMYRRKNSEISSTQQCNIINEAHTDNSVQRTTDENYSKTKDLKQTLHVREKDRIRKRLKRLDPQVKEKDRKMTRQSMFVLRRDPKVHDKHRDISRESKSKRRIDPKVQEKDRQMTQKCMSERRKDLKVQEKDRDMSRESKSKQRKNPEVQMKERQRTRKSISERRKDPKGQEKDKDINRESKSKQRKDPEVQMKERQRTRKSMSERRKDPKVQEKDRDINRESKSKQRKNPEVQMKERHRTRKSMSERRKDPKVQEKDKDINRESKSKQRKDPEVQEKQRKMDRESKSKQRKDPEHRQVHLEKARLNMQKRRLDQGIRDIEREKMKTYIRKKRQDPVVRHNERKSKIASKKLNSNCRKKSTTTRKTDEKRKRENKLRKERRRQNIIKSTSTIQLAATVFKSKFAKGCTFVCTCCYQLWFQNSVVPASGVKCDNKKLRKDCFTGKRSVDNTEWMCVTCAASIRKRKLPVLAFKNGMCFPCKPAALELNSLEERLVAPVNPFMQLRELPSGGQVSIKGNVVNVPADNVETVTSLPRQLHESGTIPVKLKRRLRYKSHYMYENVRPQQCIEAVKYLLQKPLFQEHVVHGIDSQWLASCSNTENYKWNAFLKQSSKQDVQHNMHNDERVQSTVEAVVEKSNVTSRIDEPCPAANESVTHYVQNDLDDDSDAWSEEETEGPSGAFDTMMFDEVMDSDISKCISVAPSEGNQPVSGVNPDLEELAFPTLFCGERRLNNNQRERAVKYSEVCKSELRREDRRAAMSTANIFFKTKKLQYKLIQDKVWLSMKRLQSKGKNLTAADVKDNHNIDQLVRLDEGYRIFRTLRGSPPYWEAAKKDIFAMLRQLGKPTWFLTLSAAETKWSDLLQNLSVLLDNKSLEEEDVQNLSYNTKARLIRSDPVTTARYFHHRVQAFFSYFLLSASRPLGHIADYFMRVEFQHRGSPHVHCLIWIDNGPIHKTDDPQIVYSFIDEYISTSNSTEMPDLIRRQSHRHSQTCKKKGNTCRFGIPLPPMQTTMILSPLTDTPPNELLIHKENWSAAAAAIQELKPDSDVTFEEYLHSLGLSNEQYIMALRTTIKDDRVFLRRQPNATRINAYNPDVLKTWEANMDLQFITDAYACAMYIISYISKGQRGMSDLLKRACSDARKNSTDIRQQVRSISDKFLRHVEISAQEAVYLTLQMPLRKSSRGFVFINTSPVEDRPFLLKSQEVLETLPDDSEDIKCSNIIQRYTDRPRRLESMILADFAAWYETSYSQVQQRPKTQQELPEDNAEDNIDDDIGTPEEEYEDQIKLTSGTKMRKRQKQKIIRYVRYAKKKQPENYYRESLMLFYPWRSETSLIGDSATYEEEYENVKDALELNRSRYELKAEEIDEVEEQLQNEPDNDIWDSVAPGTEHQNLRDRQADSNKDDENENLFTHYDIGVQMGLPGTDAQEETIRNRMSDDQFRETVQKLNTKQKQIFYHVLKAGKRGDSQQLLFISGGAGVGKTKVVTAVSQALIRHFNTAAGENPETTSVLLVAPTGKAAYLIKGQTIHSAFHIPANQGFTYKRLTREMCNTLRVRYQNLKFLIIDEISMVGSAMFNYINLRLQELFQSIIPFGGVHVIAVGDLFQLRPVQDNWIFKLSNKDYSSLAPNIWTDHFHLYELTEIMRQRGDKQFAETLNRIREGQQNVEDTNLLQTRVISESSPNYPVNAVHIMYYNSSVNEHNDKIYDLSPNEKVTFEAEDVAIGDIPPAVKQTILEKAPHKAKDAMGLAKYVRTAVGLRNELTVNIDTGDGMVNGASCITKHFSTGRRNKQIPSIIWVEFDHPEIGQSLRSQSKHLYLPGCSINWTPLKSITREFSVGRYKNAKILRKQFPIQMACAKTVHRSQGDTLSEAVLALPTQKRAHLHYVAFSRVTSLEKLYILGNFLPGKITVSNDVREEMIRLRTTSQLAIQDQVYQLPPTSFTVIFQNCQSLKRHIDDIRADQNFMASNILMFVETKLANSDEDSDVLLQNFSVFRNDFKTDRTPYGSAIYYKPICTCTCQVLNAGNIETTMLRVHHPVKLTIFCIYCRPKEKISSVRKHLRSLGQYLDHHHGNVIMGDFNINIDHDETLNATIFQMGFRQLVHEPTTNANTTIDHIYTDLDDARLQSGVLETYYSYHKPVWLSLLS